MFSLVRYQTQAIEIVKVEQIIMVSVEGQWENASHLNRKIGSLAKVVEPSTFHVNDAIIHALGSFLTLNFFALKDKI